MRSRAGGSILTLKYPIRHGIFTHRDDIEKIWHHTFHNELRVAPEEHPMLLTKAPPEPQRERRPRSRWRPSTLQPHICGHPGRAVPGRVWLYHRIRMEPSDWVPYIHTAPICKGCALSHAILRPDLTDYPVTILTRAWLQLRHHCRV